MGRLIEKKKNKKAEKPPVYRSLKKRWLLTVFLPTSGILAVAACAFAWYAYFTVEHPEEAILFSLCAGAAAIVALWLLGMRYLQHVTEGIAELTYFARRITEGSFGLKIDRAPTDELGKLAGEINALSTEIAQSGKLRSEFISSVSHELRTPLTAIGGWAETLAYDETIEGDSRRGVDIIAKETERLRKMVEELLDFTKIQDGRFRLNMETVDIAAEVEDAVFTYSRLMQQENLALSYECEEESIPMIEADPERMRQVMLNILDNAVKYGKNGESIEVALTADEENVTITVRDHGPGIPETELPHVKEKFYKGSGKERGSGIGLAVCEEIVSRHGGVLTIANAEGGGTLATVTLPV